MPQNKITVLYKDELYEFNIGSANGITHKLLDNNPNLWAKVLTAIRTDITYIFFNAKTLELMERYDHEN